jgi:hypothetical protein
VLHYHYAKLLVKALHSSCLNRAETAKGALVGRVRVLHASALRVTAPTRLPVAW